MIDLTNLSDSKKLKELGVPQKSEYYYRVNNGLAIYPVFKDEENRYELVQGLNLTSHEYIISSFSISEIQLILPRGYTLQDIGNEFALYYPREFWDQYNNDDESYNKDIIAEKSIDAFSQMLIYLLENNLINL